MQLDGKHGTPRQSSDIIESTPAGVDKFEGQPGIRKQSHVDNSQESSATLITAKRTASEGTGRSMATRSTSARPKDVMTYYNTRQHRKSRSRAASKFSSVADSPGSLSQDQEEAEFQNGSRYMEANCLALATVRQNERLLSQWPSELDQNVNLAHRSPASFHSSPASSWGTPSPSATPVSVLPGQQMDLLSTSTKSPFLSAGLGLDKFSAEPVAAGGVPDASRAMLAVHLGRPKRTKADHELAQVNV